MEYMIGRTVDNMREYQNLNNVKGQCITNTQYLYDTIKYNSFGKYVEFKAKAVFVIKIDNELNLTRFVTHVVLNVKDKSNDEEYIIDPSYETFSLKNKKYYDTIQSFMPIFKNTTDENKKKMLKDFVDFSEYADNINNGGLLLADRKFYNQQADYIEEKLADYIDKQKQADYVMKQKLHKL